ncbi:TspO protein [Brevundimonas sp.]|uniref:TspO protein n=1 Tax=Brevundimonas sp. TaxID=1871086 RepID=UPI002AB9AA88|nr:TspO protein [Brevundimonas sp.]MDZ4365370.1 TspO protein [Brevundimonas sp.]
MTDIDQAVDSARGAVVDFVNGEDRSLGHMLLGVAITAGFAIAATAFATRTIRAAPPMDGDGRPVTERPRGSLSLILPAVFSATTLSAVRVWNAPSRRERSVALGLWGLAQAVNATWLALRPAGRNSQIMAAMTSAGLAAAFAHEARKLDPGTGKMAAPMGAGTRVANAIDRKVSPQATLH